MAEVRSQAILMRAWLLTVGVQVDGPTWNLDMISISSTMLTIKSVELINNGTSGWSRARVEQAAATCMADDNASTDEMRTYVMDVSRTLAGTNAAASLSALAMKIRVRIAPKVT
jgi:hypothetical protein